MRKKINWNKEILEYLYFEDTELASLLSEAYFLQMIVNEVKEFGEKQSRAFQQLSDSFNRPELKGISHYLHEKAQEVSGLHIKKTKKKFFKKDKDEDYENLELFNFSHLDWRNDDADDDEAADEEVKAEAVDKDKRPIKFYQNQLDKIQLPIPLTASLKAEEGKAVIEVKKKQYEASEKILLDLIQAKQYSKIAERIIVRVSKANFALLREIVILYQHKPEVLFKALEKTELSKLKTLDSEKYNFYRFRITILLLQVHFLLGIPNSIFFRIARDILIRFQWSFNKQQTAYVSFLMQLTDGFKVDSSKQIFFWNFPQYGPRQKKQVHFKDESEKKYKKEIKIIIPAKEQGPVAKLSVLAKQMIVAALFFHQIYNPSQIKKIEEKQVKDQFELKAISQAQFTCDWLVKIAELSEQEKKKLITQVKSKSFKFVREWGKSGFSLKKGAKDLASEILAFSPQLDQLLQGIDLERSDAVNSFLVEMNGWLEEFRKKKQLNQLTTFIYLLVNIPFKLNQLSSIAPEVKSASGIAVVREERKDNEKKSPEAAVEPMIDSSSQLFLERKDRSDSSLFPAARPSPALQAPIQPEKALTILTDILQTVEPTSLHQLFEKELKDHVKSDETVESPIMLPTEAKTIVSKAVELREEYNLFVQSGEDALILQLVENSEAASQKVVQAAKLAGQEGTKKTEKVIFIKQLLLGLKNENKTELLATLLLEKFNAGKKTVVTDLEKAIIIVLFVQIYGGKAKSEQDIEKLLIDKNTLKSDFCNQLRIKSGEGRPSLLIKAIQDLGIIDYHFEGVFEAKVKASQNLKPYFTGQIEAIQKDESLFIDTIWCWLKILNHTHDLDFCQAIASLLQVYPKNLRETIILIFSNATHGPEEFKSFLTNYLIAVVNLDVSYIGSLSSKLHENLNSSEIESLLREVFQRYLKSSRKSLRRSSVSSNSDEGDRRLSKIDQEEFSITQEDRPANIKFERFILNLLVYVIIKNAVCFKFCKFWFASLILTQWIDNQKISVDYDVLPHEQVDSDKDFIPKIYQFCGSLNEQDRLELICDLIMGEFQQPKAIISEEKEQISSLNLVKELDQQQQENLLKILFLKLFSSDYFAEAAKQGDQALVLSIEKFFLDVEESKSELLDRFKKTSLKQTNLSFLTQDSLPDFTPDSSVCQYLAKINQEKFADFFDLLEQLMIQLFADGILTKIAAQLIEKVQKSLTPIQSSASEQKEETATVTLPLKSKLCPALDLEKITEIKEVKALTQTLQLAEQMIEGAKQQGADELSAYKAIIKSLLTSFKAQSISTALKIPTLKLIFNFIINDLLERNDIPKIWNYLIKEMELSKEQLDELSSFLASMFEKDLTYIFTEKVKSSSQTTHFNFEEFEFQLQLALFLSQQSLFPVDEIKSSSDVVSSEEKLKQQAKHFGYKVVPMKPDGACLFHSLGHQSRHRQPALFTKDFDTEQVYRQLTEHIAKHQKFYQNINLQQLMEDVLSRGKWGGEEVIAAFADMTGLNIVVVYDDPQNAPDQRSKYSVYRKKEVIKNEETLIIGYRGKSHYDVLVWDKTDETEEVAKIFPTLAQQAIRSFQEEKPLKTLAPEAKTDNSPLPQVDFIPPRELKKENKEKEIIVTTSAELVEPNFNFIDVDDFKLSTYFHSKDLFGFCQYLMDQDAQLISKIKKIQGFKKIIILYPLQLQMKKLLENILKAHEEISKQKNFKKLDQMGPALLLKVLLEGNQWQLAVKLINDRYSQGEIKKAETFSQQKKALLSSLIKILAASSQPRESSESVKKFFEAFNKDILWPQLYEQEDTAVYCLKLKNIAMTPTAAAAYREKLSEVINLAFIEYCINLNQIFSEKYSKASEENKLASQESRSTPEVLRNQILLDSKYDRDCGIFTKIGSRISTFIPLLFDIIFSKEFQPSKDKKESSERKSWLGFVQTLKEDESKTIFGEFGPQFQKIVSGIKFETNWKSFFEYCHQKNNWQLLEIIAQELFSRLTLLIEVFDYYVLHQQVMDGDLKNFGAAPTHQSTSVFRKLFVTNNCFDHYVELKGGSFNEMQEEKKQVTRQTFFDETYVQPKEHAFGNKKQDLFNDSVSDRFISLDHPAAIKVGDEAAESLKKITRYGKGQHYRIIIDKLFPFFIVNLVSELILLSFDTDYSKGLPPESAFHARYLLYKIMAKIQETGVGSFSTGHAFGSFYDFLKGQLYNFVEKDLAARQVAHRAFDLYSVLDNGLKLFYQYADEDLSLRASAQLELSFFKYTTNSDYSPSKFLSMTQIFRISFSFVDLLVFYNGQFKEITIEDDQETEKNNVLVFNHMVNLFLMSDAHMLGKYFIRALSPTELAKKSLIILALLDAIFTEKPRPQPLLKYVLIPFYLQNYRENFSNESKIKSRDLKIVLIEIFKSYRITLRKVFSKDKAFPASDDSSIFFVKEAMPLAGDALKRLFDHLCEEKNNEKIKTFYQQFFAIDKNIFSVLNRLGSNLVDSEEVSRRYLLALDILMQLPLTEVEPEKEKEQDQKGSKTKVTLVEEPEIQAFKKAYLIRQMELIYQKITPQAAAKLNSAQKAFLRNLITGILKTLGLELSDLASIEVETEAVIYFRSLLSDSMVEVSKVKPKALMLETAKETKEAKTLLSILEEEKIKELLSSAEKVDSSLHLQIKFFIEEKLSQLERELQAGLSLLNEDAIKKIVLSLSQIILAFAKKIDSKLEAEVGVFIAIGVIQKFETELGLSPSDKINFKVDLFIDSFLERLAKNYQLLFNNNLNDSKEGIKKGNLKKAREIFSENVNATKKPQLFASDSKETQIKGYASFSTWLSLEMQIKRMGREISFYPEAIRNLFQEFVAWFFGTKQLTDTDLIYWFYNIINFKNGLLFLIHKSLQEIPTVEKSSEAEHWIDSEKKRPSLKAEYAQIFAARLFHPLFLAHFVKTFFKEFSHTPLDSSCLTDDLSRKHILGHLISAILETIVDSELLGEEDKGLFLLLILQQFYLINPINPEATASLIAFSQLNTIMFYRPLEDKIYLALQIRQLCRHHLSSAYQSFLSLRRNFFGKSETREFGIYSNSLVKLINSSHELSLFPSEIANWQAIFSLDQISGKDLQMVFSKQFIHRAYQQPLILMDLLIWLFKEGASTHAFYQKILLGLVLHSQQYCFSQFYLASTDLLEEKAFAFFYPTGINNLFLKLTQQPFRIVESHQEIYPLLPVQDRQKIDKEQKKASKLIASDDKIHPLIFSASEIRQKLELETPEQCWGLFLRLYSESHHADPRQLFLDSEKKPKEWMSDSHPQNWIEEIFNFALFAGESKKAEVSFQLPDEFIQQIVFITNLQTFIQQELLDFADSKASGKKAKIYEGNSQELQRFKQVLQVLGGFFREKGKTSKAMRVVPTSVAYGLLLWVKKQLLKDFTIEVSNGIIQNPEIFSTSQLDYLAQILCYIFDDALGWRTEKGQYRARLRGTNIMETTLAGNFQLVFTDQQSKELEPIKALIQLIDNKLVEVQQEESKGLFSFIKQWRSEIKPNAKQLNQELYVGLSLSPQEFIFYNLILFAKQDLQLLAESPAISYDIGDLVAEQIAALITNIEILLKVLNQLGISVNSKIKSHSALKEASSLQSVSPTSPKLIFDETEASVAACYGSLLPKTPSVSENATKLKHFISLRRQHARERKLIDVNSTELTILKEEKVGASFARIQIKETGKDKEAKEAAVVFSYQSDCLAAIFPKHPMDQWVQRGKAYFHQTFFETVIKLMGNSFESPIYQMALDAFAFHVKERVNELMAELLNQIFSFSLEQKLNYQPPPLSQLVKDILFYLVKDGAFIIKVKKDVQFGIEITWGGTIHVGNIFYTQREINPKQLRDNFFNICGFNLKQLNPAESLKKDIFILKALAYQFPETLQLLLTNLMRNEIFELIDREDLPRFDIEKSELKQAASPQKIGFFKYDLADLPGEIEITEKLKSDGAGLYLDTVVSGVRSQDLLAVEGPRFLMVKGIWITKYPEYKAGDKESIIKIIKEETTSKEATESLAVKQEAFITQLSLTTQGGINLANPITLPLIAKAAETGLLISFQHIASCSNIVPSFRKIDSLFFPFIYIANQFTGDFSLYRARCLISVESQLDDSNRIKVTKAKVIGEDAKRVSDLFEIKNQDSKQLVEKIKVFPELMNTEEEAKNAFDYLKFLWETSGKGKITIQQFYEKYPITSQTVREFSDLQKQKKRGEFLTVLPPNSLQVFSSCELSAVLKINIYNLIVKILLEIFPPVISDSFTEFSNLKNFRKEFLWCSVNQKSYGVPGFRIEADQLILTSTACSWVAEDRTISSSFRIDLGSISFLEEKNTLDNLSAYFVSSTLPLTTGQERFYNFLMVTLQLDERYFNFDYCQKHYAKLKALIMPMIQEILPSDFASELESWFSETVFSDPIALAPFDRELAQRRLKLMISYAQEVKEVGGVKTLAGLIVLFKHQPTDSATQFMLRERLKPKAKKEGDDEKKSKSPAHQRGGTVLFAKLPTSDKVQGWENLQDGFAKAAKNALSNDNPILSFLSEVKLDQCTLKDLFKDIPTERIAMVMVSFRDEILAKAFRGKDFATEISKVFSDPYIKTYKDKPKEIESLEIKKLFSL